MSFYPVLPGIAVLAMLLLTARAAVAARPGLRHAISAQQGTESYLPQLEGLRGLLAIGVVLHHAVVRFILLPRTGVWGYPPSNFYAQLGSAPVLMFFFLTGFLFWSKLLRTPDLDIKPYLMARLRRLGPVYVFAMLWLFGLVAIATHFTLHTSPFALTISMLRWLGFALAGEPEVNCLAHTSYLIAGTPWTLAFEWQFYLLLPMLAWFARRQHRSLYLLAGAGLLFAASSPLLDLVRGSALHSILYAFNSLAGHLFFSFGIGIAAATARARWPGEIRLFRSTSASWFCLLAVAIVLFGRQPERFRAFDSLTLGFVFLCLVFGNDLWLCLRSRTALLLGRCSYSLYLCHGLVLATLSMAIQSARGSMIFTALAAWAWIAFGCSLSLAIAIAVHEQIESRWLVQQSDRRKVPRDLPAVRGKAGVTAMASGSPR